VVEDLHRDSWCTPVAEVEEDISLLRMDFDLVELQAKVHMMSVEQVHYLERHKKVEFQELHRSSKSDNYIRRKYHTLSRWVQEVFHNAGNAGLMPHYRVDTLRT
jgi:hypothetical protein